MAAVPVNTIVADVQGAFPDATATEIIEDLNKVDRHLATRIRLRTNTLTVSLTAQDDTYAVSDSVARVWSARYVKSATRNDSYPLQAEDVSSMDIKHPSWRSWAYGKPKYFILDADSNGDPMLILAPCPDTTTSGGYPNVKLEVTIGGTLAAGGNTPAKIQLPDVYKWGACYYYCADRHREEAAYYKALYDQAMRYEVELELNRMTQKKPGIHVYFPTGGTY